MAVKRRARTSADLRRGASDDIDSLLSRPGGSGGPGPTTLGNRLLTIGQIMGHRLLTIGQIMGHRRLPQFVGDIDVAAPYRPEALPERDDL